MWDTTTQNWYNGTSNVTWDGNVAILAGSSGTVTLSGSISANEVDFNTAGYVLSDGTLTGPTDGTLSMIANANATVSSAITTDAFGTGQVFLKDGTGTLSVGVTPSNYSEVQINNGTLDFTSGANLSETSINLSNNVGATLALGSGGLFVNGLNGGGSSGGNVMPDSTTGLLTVNVDGGTGSYGGSIQNNGGATIEIQISFGANQTLTGVNTYSGSTSIGNGTMTLAGQGSILNTSSLTISGGCTLVLDNTGTNVTNRLSDTAAITLGGTVTFLGNSAAPSSETTGGLLLLPNGVAAVGISANAAQPSSITIASLGQSSTTSEGMVVFRAANLGGTPGPGTANVYITSTPTLVGGGGAAGTPTVSILPYALTDTSSTGKGTSFATYGPNGVRPLTNAEYTSDDFTVANANVNVAAADTVSGSASINALRLNDGGSVSGSGTVTVGSGEVLGLPGTTSISTAQLAFGATSIVLDIQGTTTIGSEITGTNSTHGLAKLGPGELILTGANTYAGPTRLEAGVLNIQNGAALGTSGATTTVINGPTLQVQGSVTVGNEVLQLNGYGQGGTNLSSTGALESVSGANIWQGSVTANNASIGVDTGSLTLTGTLTANGLTKVGSGTLFLTAVPSSSSSGISVNGGSLISEATSGNPLNTTTSLVDGSFGIAPSGSGGNPGLTVAENDTLSFTGNSSLSVSKGSNTSATLTITAPLDQTVAGSTLLIVPVDGISALGVSDKFVLPTAGATANIDGILGAVFIGQNNDANLSGDFLTNPGTSAGLKVATYSTSTNLNSPGFEPVFQANTGQMLTANSLIVGLKDNGQLINLGTFQLQVEDGEVQAPTGVILNGGTIQNGTLEFDLNEGVIYTSLAGGTISSTIDGVEGLAIFGPGKLTLSGSNTYTGSTAINSGNVNLTGTITSSNGSVTLAPGATLSGTGRITNNIQGGMISPGNTVGILTASFVTPSVDANNALRNYTNFSFEFDQTGLPNFSSATASGNDVLHLTSLSSPIQGSLTSNNIVDLYFNTGFSLQVGQIYMGGFYSNTGSPFDSEIDNATYDVFVSDPSGTTTFNGNTYSSYDGAIEVSTVPETANFGSGSVNGYVMEVQIVPEPASGLALTAGAAALGLLSRPRRRSRCPERR